MKNITVKNCVGIVDNCDLYYVTLPMRSDKEYDRKLDAIYRTLDDIVCDDMCGVRSNLFDVSNEVNKLIIDNDVDDSSDIMLIGYDCGLDVRIVTDPLFMNLIIKCSNAKKLDYMQNIRKFGVNSTICHKVTKGTYKILSTRQGGYSIKDRNGQESFLRIENEHNFELV